MRTIKKLILAILFTILAFIVFSNNVSYGVDTSDYKLGKRIWLSERHMRNSDNVYCIAHEDRFGGVSGVDTEYEFWLWGKVVITGRDAYSESMISQGEYRHIKNHEDNLIISAILGGQALERGHGTWRNYNEAQVALYAFWNRYVEFNVGAGGKYFYWDECPANDDIVNSYPNAWDLVEKARQDGLQAEEDGEPYTITIWFLNVASEGTKLQIQDLIVVEAEPGKQKEGDDDDDGGDDDDDEIPHEVINPNPTEVNANVNISGFVWEDVLESKSNTLDNKYGGDGSQDLRVSGIQVYWKDAGGGIISSTTTDTNGEYRMTTTITLQNHPYRQRDLYKYDLLNNSYIEFEYNGVKYTTVASDGNITDSTRSKGEENENSRKMVDEKFNKVEDEKIYDANNNVVSNLPNSSLKNSNYLDGFNATASTQSLIGTLMSKSESNGWTRSETFCTQHCKTLRTECTGDGCSICAEYIHLGDTAKEVVIARVPTYIWWTGDANKNGKQDEKEKKKLVTTGEEKAKYEEQGWTILETVDAGLEEVFIDRYCDGKIVYRSKDDNKYVQYLTPEQKEKYPALVGDAFNGCTGGLHYYSAGETSTTAKHCLSSEDHIVEWNIYNMNLGLVKREQPNIALVSDIEKVRVIMKNQEYTYIYGNAGITDVDERVEYKLKWQNKYIAQQYSRPINPADIAYVNYNNSDELKVFVTYNMIAKNYSTTLPMTINKIVTYYDNDYTIFNGTGSVTSQGWSEAGNLNADYKIAYSSLLAGKKLAPNTQSEIIKLEFEVSQEAIKGLLNEDSTLYTVSEIFSYTTFYGQNTICAEAETATTKNRVEKIYAGITETTPGNAEPGRIETYEADTDKAPSFLLEQEKDKYKVMTGTVWEDYQTEQSKDDNERLGDGIKNGEEKGVKNVRIELIAAETGQTAEMYYITDDGRADKLPAITYTDENGNYTLGKDGEYGIVVDNYILKYTYGNDTNIIQSGIGTQLYGSDTAIDARNYKSTIIVDDVVKNLIQGNTLVDDEGNNITDKWHLYMDRDKVISIAVDDLKERLDIPDLKYDNFSTPTNMSAYTRPFKLQVQYTENNTQQMVDADGDGNIEGTVYRVQGDQTATFESDVQGFNFGIVERAREDIVVEKTVSKIKLTLANGQILIEGDPREEKLNYVKAIGMYKTEPIRSREQAKRASDKLLSIEIDSELIQGSILEMWYEITVTNNSEYDYEYYADYTDIDQQSLFVTSNPQAKYYYYGDKTGLELISPTIEIVADYMDSGTICDVGDKANQSSIDQGTSNNEWYRYDSGAELIDPDNTGEPITADRLKEKGYISEKTYNALKDGEYQIIVTDTFNELKAGGNSKTTTLYTSKLLASQEESNTFENHIEVLQLNSRIARTIQGVEDVWQINTIRKQIEKSYKPGNYIPSLTQRTINDDDASLEIPGLHQPDDDRVRVTITPPTGISNYITIYIITAVIGLIVIVGGIIFIKKKVINK